MFDFLVRTSDHNWG